MAMPVREEHLGLCFEIRMVPHDRKILVTTAPKFVRKRGAIPQMNPWTSKAGFALC